MEIQLPEVQSYFDNIKNGSITEIRLPGMETKTGEVLTAFSHAGNDRVMTIAEKKIEIILAKRLFCVLLLLFEIDRKVIVEKLGVSRLTVKKYGALIESGNIWEGLWGRCGAGSGVS
jgi:hypothetical protein